MGHRTRPLNSVVIQTLDQDIGIGPTQLWLRGAVIQIVPTHRGSVNTSLTQGLLSSLPIPSLQQNNFFPYNQNARALYVVNDPPIEAAKSSIHPSPGIVISTTIVKGALIMTYKVLSLTWLVNAL